MKVFDPAEATGRLCRPLVVTGGMCSVKVTQAVLVKNTLFHHSQSKKLQLEESLLDELVLGTPRLSSWRQTQTFITANPTVESCTGDMGNILF